jgi:hypothetical protein
MDGEVSCRSIDRDEADLAEVPADSSRGMETYVLVSAPGTAHLVSKFPAMGSRPDHPHGPLVSFVLPL